MAFITVHQENGVCGYEMSHIRLDQIAAILPPAMGGKKWFVGTTQACLRLTDGRSLNVRESADALMELLQVMKDGRTPDAPMAKEEIPDMVSEITRTAQELRAQSA